MDLSSHVLPLIQELITLTKTTTLENETSRKEALRITKLLHSVLQTPADVIFETGLLPSFALCARVAVQLNIFPILAESSPKTASELAELVNAEELLVIRVMRVLSGMGLVEEVKKETYAALPVTKVMASPPMQGLLKHFWDQSVPCMAKFPQYLAERGFKCPDDPTDGLFQYTFNTKLEAFAYWHRKPEVLDNFNTVMTGVRSTRPPWIEWFPIQQKLLDQPRADNDSPLLIDIGGNRGHDIEAFLCKFPQPKGALVVQDLPAVIDDITKLDDRIERVKYDFFQPQPIKGAKAYYFSHIFHDWSDEFCIQILRNTAAAMSPQSKLFINDIILPDTGCTLFQAGYDINMMAMHAGIERTEDQWRDLLTRANLEVVKFWPPPGDGEGIIEAQLNVKHK